jgi:hypothetical protein
LFARRHFDREVIILCVRWYLRYKLSFRDLVEMMPERGLDLAHTPILRWVRRYAPEFIKRWNRFGRTASRSWRVDETYIKGARPSCLIAFLKKAFAAATSRVLLQPDRAGPPWHQEPNPAYARLQELRICRYHDRWHRTASAHPQATVHIKTAPIQKPSCACALERGACGVSDRSFTRFASI